VRKEATREAKLSAVGNLRLKDRRGDTAELGFIQLQTWKGEGFLFIRCGVLYGNKNSRRDYSRSQKRRR
jgi:hypothetical protein